MTRASWSLARGRTIECDRPFVLAILNLTPDSFSDGGRLALVDAAVAAARDALEAGADMIDIGGESTRPGASRVPAEAQIDRIVPVVRAIRAAGHPLAAVPISIDTTLEPVARAALDAGADVINDVSGGTEDPAILRLAAERGAGLILMHRELPPDRDRYSTAYGDEGPPAGSGDIVVRVRDALGEMLERARRAGVDERAVVLDPGLGFGKTVEQNVELVVRTPELLELGRPILSAASRKSFVGAVSAPPGVTLAPGERLGGSIAFSLAHLGAGARLFRVHDVAEQARALRAAWALRSLTRGG